MGNSMWEKFGLRFSLTCKQHVKNGVKPNLCEKLIAVDLKNHWRKVQNNICFLSFPTGLISNCVKYSFFPDKELPVLS